MQNNMPTQSNADLVRLIAAYIISIGPNGASSGEVYMRNMNHCALSRHNALIGALQDTGLVNSSAHFLTLTEAGLAKHKQIAAVLMKQEVVL